MYVRLLLVCITATLLLMQSAVEARGIGNQCVNDGECQAPLVCNYGFCRQECTLDRDCARDFYCMKPRPGDYKSCIHRSAIAPAAVPRYVLEKNTDRPGNDYHSFPLKYPDPNYCARECDAAPGQCRAWTYTKPGVQGATARCYLKRAKGNKVTNKNTVSGVARPIRVPVR